MGILIIHFVPTPNISHLRTFPLAIFETLADPNCWQPSALAAGPFAGLQGGAVASLLTAEVEALAEERKWGTAVAATAWFLRPTPMTNLRTQLAVLTEGGRVSVVDNTLWPDDEAQPSATVRVTLVARARGRFAGICRYIWRCAGPDPASCANPTGRPWPALVHGRHGGARGR